MVQNEPDKASEIDWVNLSRALSGHCDPTVLDETTRARYQEIAAQGTLQPAPPSQSDLEAEQFWAEVREMEVANAEAIGLLGLDTPEHTEWIRQIRELYDAKTAASPPAPSTSEPEQPHQRHIRRYDLPDGQ